ncbi:MAG: MFS transporter [Gammaproteobacteria bacterium]|jgi:MFS family permease|nr:MFS transporter [Gammaproteobacteria bacterium]MBT7603820.1 MFS transporter [Gammaproteobacteria bacterium]
MITEKKYTALVNLLLQVLFVGILLGLFRTAIPALSESVFLVPKNSFIFLSTFIIAFGIIKGIANYYAGVFADKYNRKTVLLLGWLVAFPVPFIIYFATNWYYIILATFIIGINQGLTWSVTQISSVDITKNENRGFIVGLNEFSGYFGVAIGGILVSYMTSLLTVKIALFLFSIIFILIATLYCIFLVKETKSYANIAFGKNPKNVFLYVTWTNKKLFAYSQAGHIEKFVDTCIWIFFPVYLFNNGVTLIEISYIVGTYTFTWGIFQIFTGLYSDYVGRNLLIISGMLICSIVLPLCLLSLEFSWWMTCSFFLGLGMALLYPSISSAVNDNCDDSWRASAIGIYRFWRDTGYATGALGLGIVTSLVNIEAGFIFVSFSMILSTLILIFTLKKYS